MAKKSTVGTVVAALVAALVWWFSGTGSVDDTEPPAANQATTAPSSQSAPSDQPAPSGQPTANSSDGEAPSRDEDGFSVVEVQELPEKAAEVLDEIDAGGPFDHPEKDGTTFGNYEGLLPQERRGYYREYTVETPGLNHRGARRIVTGSEGQYYWTEDHYESFERIWR